MRNATEQEKTQIVTYIANRLGIATEEVSAPLNRARIAVFEDYTPGTPGYTGKIAVIVWPASASMIESYGFADDKAYLIGEHK